MCRDLHRNLYFIDFVTCETIVLSYETEFQDA